MRLRDELDSSVLEAPVIHLDVMTGGEQFLVLEVRPLLTPVLQLRVGIPGPDLFAEPLFRNLSGCQEDVSMGITFLCVDVNVCDHTVINKVLCDEFPDELFVLLKSEFGWEGEFYFSRELGVFATLDSLYLVPEG